jgi:1-acyl-sn-glycerol-3-phosphate acyltransferase
VVLSPGVIFLFFTNASTATVRRFSLFWARGCIYLLRHIVGLNFREIGRENVVDRPMLIISNHQSTFETLALPVLFPNATFVAKAELTRIPAFGWCLKNYPMILIDRSAGTRSIVQIQRAARAAIDQGLSVVIFPEGTRKSVSENFDSRRGAEFLYKTLNVPVLPIAINSGLFWGRGMPFKHRGIITISYLPVIEPGMDVEEFRAKIQRNINAEKQRLVAEFE